MGLREQKKLETRARILEAARRLFLQTGFAGTTADAIATSVGISRASLFNYFPGKASILEALAADFEPRLVRLVEHYVSRPQSSQARLTAY